MRLLARVGSGLDEVRDVVKRIIDDGHRASQVLASIRAMFRKGHGENSWVIVPELVYEVLVILQAELKSRRVSLRVELHEGFLEWWLIESCSSRSF